MNRHPHFYAHNYYNTYHTSQNYLLNPPIKFNIFSTSKPSCGQKNRSSNNFLLPPSAPGGQYTVTSPPGVSFDVMISKTGKDSTVGSYSNGAIVNITPGNNYYIASPTGATSSFFVTLTGPLQQAF